MERLLGVRKTFNLPYRFVIAGLILLAHLSIGLNFFVVSPLLLLIIEEYEITRATAGLLIALPLLIAAAFGLPGGAVIGRVGLRRVFGSAWLLMGLLVLSSWATNFPTLLALRLSFGVGFAVILTATGPLLMQWFPPKEILIMNSLNTAIISLGIALSVSTAAPIASLMGWQNALGLFGAVGLVGATAWALLGRTSDTWVKEDSPHVPLNGIAAVLGSRAILLLVAADAGVLIQYTALTSWLPTFYTETRGFSLSQAGFLTGLLPLVGVVAVLLGGFLPSRIGTRRLFFTAPGIMVILGGLGSFLFVDSVIIYMAVIVLGMGSWFYVPLLLSLPMEMKGMTPEKVAIVWGTFVTVGGIGMFVSPLLVGILRDISGTFLPGFFLCAVAGWLLLAAGVFLPRSSFEANYAST